MCNSPYYLNDAYYGDVSKFADDFLDFARSYFSDDVEILEGLIIASYWKLFNCSSLDELFDYLEYIGEFDDQLPYLRKHEDVGKYMVLSTWFLRNSSKYLGQYTLNLNKYLENYKDLPKTKKDEIFFNSSYEFYHLNMLAAEIMGRITRQEYESRKRKAIILPTCMKINQNKCQATNHRLGEVCNQCNPDCNVAKIKKDYDCEIYMVSHKSSTFKDATDDDKKELGIIGVACTLNLISGGFKALKLGIPPQCVLLECVACKRHWLREDVSSNISKNKLKEVI